MEPTQDNFTRAYFNTRFQENKTRDRVWRYVTDYLTPYWNLPNEASVLELGTGYGSWIRAVPAKNRTALDLHPDIEKIFADSGITGVKPVTGDCTDLSRWKDSSLDLVLASNLLEHLVMDDAIKCIDEVRRILKPGGKFCVVQPNFATNPHRYFDDFTHRTIFTDVSLNDLFEARGLRVTKIWRKFMPLTMKSSASRLTFLVPFYLRSPIKPLAGQMCIISQK